MKRQQETYPPWLSLPTDLIIIIFEYGDVLDLLSLGRINRNIRKLSRLVMARADSLNLSYLALLHRGRSRYQHARQYHDLIVARILDEKRSCTRLELSGLRHVTGMFFATGLRNIPHVVDLNLSGCQQMDPVLLEAALEIGLSETLSHIDLSGCSRIGAGTVSFIATSIKRLRSLALEGCSQSINDACIQKVCNQHTQLQVLNVSGLNRLTNKAVGEISKLSDLEVLKIASCEKVELDWVSTWRAQGGMLCEWVQDQGITTVAQAVKEGNISAIGPYFERWRQRNGAGSRLVNPDFAQFWRKWKRLAVLDAMGASDPRNCFPGIFGLAVCLTFGALREVNFSSCHSLSDVDVKLLAATCSKSLTTLEMVGCSNVGDEAIKALAEHECTKLAYLDISACLRISDEGVISLCPNEGFVGTRNGEVAGEGSFEGAMKRGCPALRSLKLRAVDITDKTVLAIGGMIEDNGGLVQICEEAGLSKLLMLSVHSCNQVTSFAVGKMLSRCRSLVELDARDTDNSLHSSLSSLLTPSHSLRVINGRRCTRLKIPRVNRHCTVNLNSQRLTSEKGITLQPMMHCIDCNLVPFQNRGMCRRCAETCHRGHQTFLGSLTRFYCDCAYSIHGEECQALA